MCKKDSAACHTCHADLARCKTIFAAEGRLYCSRECGIVKYLTNSAVHFDSVAEEITPEEIGLEVINDET